MAGKTIADLDVAIANLRAASILDKADKAENVVRVARDIIADQVVTIDNLETRVGRLEATRSGGPAERAHHG